MGLCLTTRKSFHVLNRTLRWCRDGLVFFAADVRDATDELALARSKPVTSPSRSGRCVWASRRQSAPSGRRGEPGVPANRGKAQLPHTRPVGLEVCHLMSLPAQPLLPALETCKQRDVLQGACGKLPWHGRDSVPAIPDLECSFASQVPLSQRRRDGCWS